MPTENIPTVISPTRHEEKKEGRTKWAEEQTWGYVPCRDDLASAAISWMVRALRDLGSIATVSPTFTLSNTIRRSVSPDRNHLLSNMLLREPRPRWELGAGRMLGCHVIYALYVG